MSEERKSIGAGQISKAPDKRLRLKLGESVVKTENIADRAITTDKLANDSIQFIQSMIGKSVEDLQNQIDSLQIHGMAVSNVFGTDTHIGISQKTITEAINKIWQKIEDMAGEALQGIHMTVSPDYFISETGADIHITADTVEANGIFEHITFYIDGTMIFEASNVDHFEYDYHIDNTAVVMCKGKILGIEYTVQKVITHYNSFWLGAGNSYSDIMDEEHVIPITNGMRGAYDINVEQGQHFIIVVGASLREGFIRADMNGFEIDFIESAITIDGVNYKVFTSDNVYNEGTYNIDING